MKLIIKLAGSWVLRHREDEVLPVDFLAQNISEQLGSKITIEDTGLTGIILSINDEESAPDEIVAKIKDIFTSQYSIEDANKVLSIKLQGEPEESESSEEEERDESRETLVKMGEKVEDKEESDSDSVSGTEKCLEKSIQEVVNELTDCEINSIIRVAEQ